MWKNEKFCLLVHKHLFVFKIRIIRGSPIEMMEVSGRDQGKSLLVDNNLMSIYFSRYNNEHQIKKYQNEEHDIKEKEMLKLIKILIFPPFIFHVLFFQRQGHEEKSFVRGHKDKRMDISLGG